MPQTLTTVLTLALEDLNNSVHGPLYIGTRRRVASATGVRFLDPGRMLVTSLVGQRMYVVRLDLDQGRAVIESAIETVYQGRGACTDLIDFDGHNLIATSNFYEHSVSLYQLDGDRVAHLRDLAIP